MRAQQLRWQSGHQSQAVAGFREGQETKTPPFPDFYAEHNSCIAPAHVAVATDVDKCHTSFVRTQPETVQEP